MEDRWVLGLGPLGVCTSRLPAGVSTPRTERGPGGSLCASGGASDLGEAGVYVLGSRDGRRDAGVQSPTGSGSKNETRRRPAVPNGSFPE